MLTQSYRLIHIGLESRLFHVRGLTAPSLDPWVSLCHWEVLGRLTDTGFNLLKQSYKDWKRCLPAHQNADTHTRAWGAWAIRETHYHQMNKGETVIPSESPNPGSWRSAHCLTRDQNSPWNPVCCEGKTQRQPRRLRAQEPAEQMKRGFVDESEEQRKREGQTVDLENKRKEDTDQARHGGTVILPADTGGSQSSRPASVTEWVQGKSGKPNEILSQNKR